MRCVDCNKNLTDEESVRKDDNGEYMDLCNECLSNFYRDIYADMPLELLDDYTDVQSLDEDDDGG